MCLQPRIMECRGSAALGQSQTNCNCTGCFELESCLQEVLQLCRRNTQSATITFAGLHHLQYHDSDKKEIGRGLPHKFACEGRALETEDTLASSGYQLTWNHRATALRRCPKYNNSEPHSLYQVKEAIKYISSARLKYTTPSRITSRFTSNIDSVVRWYRI